MCQIVHWLQKVSYIQEKLKDVQSVLWFVEKLLNQHVDSDHTGWEQLLIDVDFTLVLKEEEEKLWDYCWLLFNDCTLFYLFMSISKHFCRHYTTRSEAASNNHSINSADVKHSKDSTEASATSKSLQKVQYVK